MLPDDLVIGRFLRHFDESLKATTSDPQKYCTNQWWNQSRMIQKVPSQEFMNPTQEFMNQCTARVRDIQVSVLSVRS